MSLVTRAATGVTLAGLLAAPLWAAPAYAATPAPTTGASTTDPARAAAGWLAGQLTGPQADHLTSSYVDQNGATQTYADQGLTADAVLSFDAAGVAQDAAKRATTWLATQVDAYAGTAPNYYPGSLAKLILVAVAQGEDPHAFGNTDLVKALQGEEASDGLYTDPDTQNGYQSVVTQALALVALSRTDTKPDAKAVSWLAGQQCADGGFQTDVRTSTSAPCTSDADTTSFAVQALAATRTDASKAVAWLTAHRNSDNGFGTPSSNANSTAIAVQALLAAGGDPSASIAYLRGLQVGCAGTTAQRGAVTFSGTFRATAVRATSQAAQALAGKTLAQITESGAGAAAPTLACAATATPTPTPTATRTVAPLTDGHVQRPAPLASSGTAELPRTGSSAPVVPLVAAALAALAIGAVLLRWGRRTA